MEEKPASRMKLFIGIAAGISVVLAGGVLFHFYRDGVLVEIENRGPTDIHHIRVLVTGREYTVETLHAGETKVFRVRPTGDSTVVLKFENAAGEQREFHPDVYFGKSPLYRGRIFIALKDGETNEHRISIRLWSWADMISLFDTFRRAFNDSH